MKKFITAVFALVFSLSLLTASDIASAKNDKSHGKGHEKVHEKETVMGEGIGSSNREAIKLYLQKNYAKKCPPGLAKKNTGCLPPGIAKKFVIGQPLSNAVVTAPLPDDLLQLLYPAGYGQKYIQVDKDILLIDQASRKVIDAVTLLSAVGK